MSDPLSLAQILWSGDPATRRALWTILGLIVPIASAVYLPLMLRALRLFLLERRLRDTLDEYETKGPAAQRSALREWVRDSPLQRQFEDFERRWSAAQVSDGGGRAPIRLLDVLEDQPLLPIGPRRSLLPVLPGLFLGIGMFGALFGLIPSVAAVANPATGSGASDPLALQLALALRATAWGFAAAISSSLAGRLIEGSFDARSRGLDDILARAFDAVSPGELAEITRQSQQTSIATLGRELTQFAHELNERLERGLQRIEQSSARAASLVSQEQRGALHTVVQELSLAVRQGVEHHLAELRGALQRAVDYQSSVTNGLSETFERMVENAQVQDRVARTLTESANALDEAARSLRSQTSERAPVTDSTGAGRAVDGFEGAVLRESEALGAQIADELGQALLGFTEQVQQIDRTMEALRQALQDGSGPDPTTTAGDPAPPARSGRAAPTSARSASPTAGERPLAANLPPRRPGDAAEPGSPPLAAAALATRAPARSAALAPAPAAPALDAPAASPAPSPTASPSPAPPTATTTPPAPAAGTGAAPGSGAATAASSASVSATVAAAPTAAPISDRTNGPDRADRSDVGADVAAADGPIGRELSLSGFRVGAPRAQGPDPYERLARGSEPSSNVRPFPTRERELGDELKLSGLLGPSSPPGAGPGAAPARRRPTVADDRSGIEPTTSSDEQED